MPELIKKFIQYLEELKTKQYSILVIKRATLEIAGNEQIEEYNPKVIDYLIKTAENPNTGTMVFFTEFNVLSQILLNSPFNNRERFTIVDYYMQKNIPRDKNKEVRFYDLQEVLKHPLLKNDQKNIMTFVESTRYYDILNGTAENVTLEERNIFLKLVKIFNEFDAKHNYVNSRILELANHFYKPNLTKEDIEISFKLFEEFGVSPLITNPHKTRMLNKITNNSSEEITTCKVLPSKTKPKVQENPQYRKELLQELANDFDLSTLTNKTIIEGEKLDRIVFITKTLGLNLNIRKRIIENNHKMREAKHNELLNSLMNAENLNIYQNLTAYLDQKENIGYKNMFSPYLNEINELIYEYSQNESPLLLQDYQEQIALIFTEICSYLPYLPLKLL